MTTIDLLDVRRGIVCALDARINQLEFDRGAAFEPKDVWFTASGPVQVDETPLDELYPELKAAQERGYLKEQNDALRQDVQALEHQRDMAMEGQTALKAQIDALTSELEAWKAEANERAQTIERYAEAHAQQQRMLEKALQGMGQGNVCTIPQDLTTDDALRNADRQWDMMRMEGFKLACAPVYNADMTKRALTFVRDNAPARPSNERQLSVRALEYRSKDTIEGMNSEVFENVARVLDFAEDFRNAS